MDLRHILLLLNSRGSPQFQIRDERRAKPTGKAVPTFFERRYKRFTLEQLRKLLLTCIPPKIIFWDCFSDIDFVTRHGLVRNKKDRVDSSQ